MHSSVHYGYCCIGVNARSMKSPIRQCGLQSARSLRWLVGTTSTAKQKKAIIIDAPNGKSSLSIGRIEIPQRSSLLPSQRYAILSVGSTGGFGLRRRDFITLLGGAAAWPLGAHAQQSDRVYRVGMLTGQPEADPENASRLAAFRQALGKFGWSEGRNLLIDIRWGAGDPDRMRVLAKELNGLAPDIVVSESTPATAALRQEIPNVPIVFSQVANPVGAGFAASLARPGGNITGFTNFEPSMGGKWLELLKELAPHVARTTAIFNPKTHSGQYWERVGTTNRSMAAIACAWFRK